jgi:hypothetical protein
MLLIVFFVFNFSKDKECNLTVQRFRGSGFRGSRFRGSRFRVQGFRVQRCLWPEKRPV